MKLFSTYIKEMKIASRGFYFYVEIFIAVLVLIILLVAVKENPDGKSKEYVFYDMPDEVAESLFEYDIQQDGMRFGEDEELTIKPGSFQVLNKDTGLEETYEYEDKKIISVRTVIKLNKETGAVTGKAYIMDNKEDMIRLSNSTGAIGAAIIMNELGDFAYEYYLQGYETERLSDVLYILHSFSGDEMLEMKEKQSTIEIGSSERLNNREAVVPIFIAFSGALMGFFIIMSYVFLDKSEGVIKAYVVTPASMWKYLLSKTFVILTTVLISSSIIVIPIMKLKPNYLLLYAFLIASSFLFSCLGLLVASFFDTISKAFGVLYFVMIGLMLPAFSYYISSFDPIWIRFLPTYPILEGFKGIMKGQADVGYVLTYTAIFLVGGVILLSLANMKFKKSLTT